MLRHIPAEHSIILTDSYTYYNVAMRPEIRHHERFARALSVRQNYESHLKKLSLLSKQKGPYAMDKASQKLLQLRARKQNDYLRIRNKKLQSIDKANSTIFQRLLVSQQLGRNTCVSNATVAFLRSSASQRSPRKEKPYMQRKLLDAQFQNQRLFGKITVLKSTIDRKKIESEYEASRRHKYRISKFEGSLMKKNKFVQRQLSKRHTSFSSRGEEDGREGSASCAKDVKSSSTVFSRNHCRSFYDPKDIIKNKVEQSILTKNRLKQLHRISFRPFNEKLCTDINKFVGENVSLQEKRFFATEIQNIQSRSKSKKLNDAK